MEDKFYIEKKYNFKILVELLKDKIFRLDN